MTEPAASGAPGGAAVPRAGNTAGETAVDTASGWDGAALAALQLALRARGVRSLALLRAMEQVPRAAFVDERHAALVARDLPVPIAAGQTASPGWLNARMIEALLVQPGQRVLQVGAGSGYATAILASLGAAVLALERVRALADHAATRLAERGIAGADVRWADAPMEIDGRFDRILVHALCPQVPRRLRDALAPDGVLVCARPNGAGQSVVRLAAGAAGWTETAICPCRLPAIRSWQID